MRQTPTKKEMQSSFAWLEPQAQRGLQAAHRVGRKWLAELRASQSRVPAGKDGMIQQVRRVDARIEKIALAGSKRSLQRAIETERTWPGDRVARRRSPIA